MEMILTKEEANKIKKFLTHAKSFNRKYPHEAAYVFGADGWLYMPTFSEVLRIRHTLNNEKDIAINPDGLIPFVKANAKLEQFNGSVRIVGVLLPASETMGHTSEKFAGVFDLCTMESGNTLNVHKIPKALGIYMQPKQYKLLFDIFMGDVEYSNGEGGSSNLSIVRTANAELLMVGVTISDK